MPLAIIGTLGDKTYKEETRISVDELLKHPAFASISKKLESMQEVRIKCSRQQEKTDRFGQNLSPARVSYPNRFNAVYNGEEFTIIYFENRVMRQRVAGGPQVMTLYPTKSAFEGNGQSISSKRKKSEAFYALASPFHEASPFYNGRTPLYEVVDTEGRADEIMAATNRDLEIQINIRDMEESVLRLRAAAIGIDSMPNQSANKIRAALLSQYHRLRKEGGKYYEDFMNALEQDTGIERGKILKAIEVGVIVRKSNQRGRWEYYFCNNDDHPICTVPQGQMPENYLISHIQTDLFQYMQQIDKLTKIREAQIQATAFMANTEPKTPTGEEYTSARQMPHEQLVKLGLAEEVFAIDRSTGVIYYLKETTAEKNGDIYKVKDVSKWKDEFIEVLIRYTDEKERSNMKNDLKESIKAFYSVMQGTITGINRKNNK